MYVHVYAYYGMCIFKREREKEKYHIYSIFISGVPFQIDLDDWLKQQSSYTPDVKM